MRDALPELALAAPGICPAKAEEAGWRGREGERARYKYAVLGLAHARRC